MRNKQIKDKKKKRKISLRPHSKLLIDVQVNISVDFAFGMWLLLSFKSAKLGKKVKKKIKKINAFHRL